MWGIVPATDRSRSQPRFSRELVPVGSHRDGALQQPRAVSEYLLERMVAGGATKICFVVSPEKADVLAYFGTRFGPAPVRYVVQPSPAGPCDALFRAGPLVAGDEPVLVGSPEAIWFPVDGFARLGTDELSFLLFEVARPERHDAVLTDPGGRVREIRVRARDPGTAWVWGALAMPGRVLRELAALWRARERRDTSLGTLVDAWIAAGGRARGVPAGESYVDVGTPDGYRDALRLLTARARDGLDAPCARAGEGSGTAELAWAAHE